MMKRISLLALLLVLPGFADGDKKSDAEIRIVSPFEPKPIGMIPEGWKIEINEEAKPVRRWVTLKDGTKQRLKLKPFILRPAADAESQFEVKDPGYRPEKGYRQAVFETVLAKQGDTLRESEAELEEVLERLDDLLLTLPVIEQAEAGDNEEKDKS